MTYFCYVHNWASPIYSCPSCNKEQEIIVSDSVTVSFHKKPCPNCARLEEDTINAKRLMAHGVRQLEEIQKLQAQLAMCKEALRYYRGSDDDETSWMEPDQYVPYWTLWHDGNCVNGQKAKEALAEIRKKDE